MAEGKKANPLLIVAIILGFLVVALGTSTTVLLLSKNSSKCKDDGSTSGDKGKDSIDISGDLTVSLAKKIDEKNDYVFDSDNKVGNYKKNNYPIINIDTSSVRKMNQDIEKSYLEVIDQYQNYAYFYKVYNKYLSIVCYYNKGYIPIVDNSFVVDLTTGLVFESSDLLEIFGLKDESIPDKAVEAAFTEYDKDLNNLIDRYPRMSEEDRGEILIETTESLNKKLYFVDDSGRLYQIYSYASFGDKGFTGEYKIIDMSDYSIASYEIEE